MVRVVTKNDSISEALRQMCNYARGHSLTEDDIAVRALADRLSLGGEPRVGDLVEARHPVLIAVVVSRDGGAFHAVVLGRNHVGTYDGSELRIIRRAGYDVSALPNEDGER